MRVSPSWFLKLASFIFVIISFRFYYIEPFREKLKFEDGWFGNRLAAGHVP